MDGANEDQREEPPGKQRRVAEGAASATAKPRHAPSMKDLRSVLNFSFTGPKRLQGRVKWFNKEKGFGKIDDIFVHKRDIEGGTEGPNYSTISTQIGALVSYETKQREGKPCAINVRCEGLAKMSATAAAESVKKADTLEDSRIRDFLMHSLKSGYSQETGKGKTFIEDRMVERAGVEVGELGASQRKAVCAFFGVFDGHGGASCSDFVATQLDKSISDCLRDQKKREASSDMALRSAVLAGFRVTEHNYRQYANKLEGGAARSWAASGSTACTATIFGPDEEGRLRVLIANLGDSRAILGKHDGEAVRLSTDHKPGLTGERQRIEQVGGTVAKIGSVWRVILKAGRGQVAAGLSVSRSFGDIEFKVPAEVVSPMPEVSTFVLDRTADDFIILASDGIWDNVTDMDAVRLVTAGLREGGRDPPRDAACKLVEAAHQRDPSDDKTALVIWFGGIPNIDESLLAKTLGSEASAPVAQHQEGGNMFEDGTDSVEIALLDDIFTSYAKDMGVAVSESSSSSLTEAFVKAEGVARGKAASEGSALDEAKRKPVSAKVAKNIF